jgi:hypothetical protein
LRRTIEQSPQPFTLARLLSVIHRYKIRASSFLNLWHQAEKDCIPLFRC